MFCFLTCSSTGKSGSGAKKTKPQIIKSVWVASVSLWNSMDKHKQHCSHYWGHTITVGWVTLQMHGKHTIRGFAPRTKLALFQISCHQPSYYTGLGCRPPHPKTGTLKINFNILEINALCHLIQRQNDVCIQTLRK